MKYGLKEETIDKINEVFSKYSEIKKVIIYGSRAKGSYKNGSDIDLTLIGENIKLEQLNKIDNELDNLMLPYSFDLSAYKELINKEFIEHIDRVGLVFFNREEK